jgi:hypothetical protein
MKFMKVALIASLAISSLSYASTNKSFDRGALSKEQSLAWAHYVEKEANYNDCKYQDDPRLTTNPQKLFEDLQSNSPIKPVMITYRSFLNIGPNTRNLISKNIVIASMECNPVYLMNNQMIGFPIIPFEEAISIMHDDYANNKDKKRLIRLRDTFFVGNIDPRWFWMFFVADKDHMDMIGLDFENLKDVQAILEEDSMLAINQKVTKKNYAKNSHFLLHDIFTGLNNNGINFYSDSGECVKTKGEPKHAILIWPNISPEVVKEFYTRTKNKGKVEWVKRIANSKQEGLSKYIEKKSEKPESMYFNYERHSKIESRECE